MAVTQDYPSIVLNPKKQNMSNDTAGDIPHTPSEFDDEIDDAALPFGYAWAYPCKLPSCPDYGKSWLLRSNFLLHLQEQEMHLAVTATPSARRAIEVEWRYVTDLHLPPRAAPGFRSRAEPGEQIWTYSIRTDTGRVLTRTGTQRQMDEDLQRRRGIGDVH